MTASLVDMHCHLLAGLDDDGPATTDVVLEMCRIAHEEGTQLVAATAHQNKGSDRATPQRIRESTAQLSLLLQQQGIPLTVFPSAEVMAHPEMESSWDQGKLMSLADRGKYLLVEMPYGVLVDLRNVVRCFRAKGVRIILAHPERQSEFLHDAGVIEAMIEGGCLVQVSSSSVTQPDRAADERALKHWFQRGCVHLIGSDGHSQDKRPPLLAAAYRRISRWAGTAAANQICSSNGQAVLRGEPLFVSPPQPRRSWWAPRSW